MIKRILECITGVPATGDLVSYPVAGYPVVRTTEPPGEKDFNKFIANVYSLAKEYYFKRSAYAEAENKLLLIKINKQLSL